METAGSGHSIEPNPPSIESRQIPSPPSNGETSDAVDQVQCRSRSVRFEHDRDRWPSRGCVRPREPKKDIIAHIAGDFNEYQRLLQRFREFSDLKCERTSEQLGYRTLLVHHGRFLEEVVESHSERRSLFLELQAYAGAVISHLLSHRHAKWTEVVEYRAAVRHQLLNKPK
jgi:hypothetical protein